MREILESAYNQAIYNCTEVRDSCGMLQPIFFDEWYAQNKSKIDDILEEQKVKTTNAMINLFEIMIRNQSDINWKQALLQQVSKLKSE